MGLMIFVILLGGLILRLISLNQSFWLDEAISTKVSGFNLGQINQFLRGDFNPPLYYLLIKLWQLFLPLSEISLRIPSLVFGLGTIFLTFKLAQNLLGKHSWLAALMLATSPLHIYYSQEARAYALTAFLFTLTLWLFTKTRKNPQYWWAFSISMLLMASSHYQTFLALPIFPLLLLIEVNQKQRSSKDWKKLILAFLPLVIALIGYWPIFLAQLGIGTQIDSAWKQVIGNLTCKNIALVGVKFVIGRISLTPPWLYGISSFLLVLFYWGLAVWGSGQFLKKKNYLPLAFFLPLILGMAISFKIPLFSYFRFLFLLPLFYILIIKGVVNFPNQKSKKIMISLLIGLNLTFSLIYLFNPTFQRENWRQVVNFLQENYPQTPVFIHPQIDSAFVYYNRQGLITISSTDFDHYNQINLISYGLPIVDPQDEIRNSLKNYGFRLIWGDSFNQVGIEKWQREEPIK